MSAGTPTEMAVGGLVLAAAAGFLIYAAQVAGLGQAGSSYELRAAFRSVEGVRVGTDVRLAGVSVGSVNAVTLDPQTFMAETRFSIRDGIELPDDTTAIVASEGLLGGIYLELAPGGSPYNLAPGDEVQDTQGSVSLTGLLMKFVGGSADKALEGDAASGETSSQDVSE